MAKNVCVFSDGTGQGGSVKNFDNTNVWKLYEAAEAGDPGRTRQVCFYDPGLGADSDEWIRWSYNLLSKATGLGISKNIKDCYAHILEHHEPGDRIYLFGFSRGAYTVRSLGGVLKLCGVPTAWRTIRDEGARIAARTALVEEAVETVYKHYGNSDGKKFERRRLGDAFRTRTGAHEAPPYFVGVWDTVRSLGLPGTSGLMTARHAFHDATLDGRVRFARQALAIDENRESFQPELWEVEPADTASGRIKQCWFPGVHSDVGGGYGDDTTLAELALAWMAEEATSAPPPDEALLVDASRIPVVDDGHAVGLQHDELRGFSLFRRGTRERHHAPPWRECATIADPSVGRRLRAKDVATLDGPRPYRPNALATRLAPNFGLDG